MTSLYKGGELKYTIWLISKHFWEGGEGILITEDFFFLLFFTFLNIYELKFWEAQAKGAGSGAPQGCLPVHVPPGLFLKGLSVCELFITMRL